MENFSAAISTVFNSMIDVNNELRQQTVHLKADCDRLSAERTDALKVFAVLRVLTILCWLAVYWWTLQLPVLKLCLYIGSHANVV